MFRVFGTMLCIKESSHRLTFFGEHYRDRAESWQLLSSSSDQYSSSSFYHKTLR